MEAKQTAVEWFANRIKHGGLVSKKQFDELIEQAKAMEKEQIIDAFNQGFSTPQWDKQKENKAKQYYYKTLKTE